MVDDVNPKPLVTGFGKGFYLGRQSAETMSSLIDNLLDRVEKGQGLTLHEARNRVVAVDAESSAGAKTNLALKIFAEPRGWKRFESLFRAGKARRAFFIAVHLRRHYVPTPSPVAYAEKRDHGMLRRSVMITERVWGVELRSILHGKDERFIDGPTPEFVNKLGRFLRKIHEAGVIHRDISDGNVLVEFEGNDPRFMLLDLNRGRIKGRVGTVGGIRDIIRVGVQPGLQQTFLTAYLGGDAPPMYLWFLYRMMKKRFEMKLKMKRIVRMIVRKTGTGSSS